MKKNTGIIFGLWSLGAYGPVLNASRLKQNDLHLADNI